MRTVVSRAPWPPPRRLHLEDRSRGRARLLCVQPVKKAVDVEIDPAPQPDQCTSELEAVLLCLEDVPPHGGLGKGGILSAELRHRTKVSRHGSCSAALNRYGRYCPVRGIKPPSLSFVFELSINLLANFPITCPNQLLSDPIQFSWGVPRRGYEWVMGAPLKPSHAGEVYRYLSESGKRSRPSEWRLYQPLETHSGLFRDFAMLEPTEDAVLRFASKFGRLGDPIDEFMVRVGSETVEVGERLWDWGTEISAVRRIFELWEAARERKVGWLKKFIRWEGQRLVYFCTQEGYRLGDPIDRAHGFWSIASAETRPHVLKEFRPGDVVQPALVHVQRIVNEALDGHVSARLLRVNDQIRMCHVPKSLRSALWLQFGQAVAGNKNYRQCARCPRWFEIGPRAGRRDKMYCGVSCRVLTSRSRKWRS